MKLENEKIFPIVRIHLIDIYMNVYFECKI